MPATSASSEHPDRVGETAGEDAQVSADRRRARWALQSLFFFSADQTGIGPFFGVFLAQHGWRTGMMGTVMTLGGLAGLLVTTPAGALVDATTRKRTYVIVSCLFAVGTSLMIWASQSVWVVGASQVMGAVGGAAIGPAMMGLTLGVFRRSGFDAQNGRNQAFNHAGNVLGAAISGLIGWKFGFGAVFLMGIGLGSLSIASTLAIPRAAVDDAAARGLAVKAGEEKQPRGLEVLFQCRPLLALAACLVMFHLGNGAMLPLYGLAVVQAHKADPAMFAAMVVVVAQVVMVVASLVGARLIKARGYWLVVLVTFAVLPLRCVLAASLITFWGVFPVQVLDGIAAGLQGVAVSGLIVRLLDGTGRINAGQGAIGTAQGIGASLSPAIGGWLAQAFGYPTAFIVLGALPLGSVALWLACGPMIRKASA
ncbi:MAG: MFS transporter [Caulobacteraceae bacterium]